MVDIDPEMSAHLDHVVDGLVNETGGAIPRHELREVVFDCYERLAKNATITAYLPLLTGRYAMVQIRAMGILSGDLLKTKPEILILDEHNSARSQTASALIRFYAPGRFRVESGGVAPAEAVNPLVVQILDDAGIRLTDFPKPATREMVTAADHVIAIGDLPATLSDGGDGAWVRWDVADPSATDHEGAVAILAGLDTRVREFLREVDPGHSLHAPVLAVPD